MSIKRILWFNTALVQSGGGERLGMEAVRYFQKEKIDAAFIVFNYDQEAVFEGRYTAKVICLNSGQNAQHQSSKSVLARMFSAIGKTWWLRKQIQAFKPDLIITQGTWEQPTYVYFATLFTAVPYVVHIFGSIFAFPPTHELTKYGLIFRKHFHAIRESNEGYQAVVPVQMPAKGLLRRLNVELMAFLKYLSVRKAGKLFVLSYKNQWEVQKLYGREARVLKGAIPKEIFSYQPKADLKERLGLQGKRIVLSICRLAVNKRVDLCLKAFARLIEQPGYDDLVLVIGGKGPEEGHLKQLMQALHLVGRVIFIGYVPDSELWDYMIGCDVFVHLDLADFDIAPFEALALGRKVVWSNEMEIDELLRDSRFIYPTRPDAGDTAEALRLALQADPADPLMKGILFYYNWDNYASQMLKEMQLVPQQQK